MTRTRFAPSPTGALHCGTVRTAFFAWLLARHDDGQFLLRIEDTDQKREVEGGTDNIKETLRWLGLIWDEGPDIEGPHGPYIQSQRLEIYQQYARELYDKGLAYADPHTPEELQALREKAQAEKRPFLFREHRPENPPAWDSSQPLRIKLEPKDYAWDDLILGRVEMGPEMIDDYIIIKADGFPTYNFAHIIDDHLMQITHVMRSQEFISSIPKYLATSEALGFPAPINAILPAVLGETGGTKLSKRLGAQPILHYREAGYLPEAMLNLMATLGWNDGTEQEIFTLDELIDKFSLERVQKSPARFDEARLLWMNGQWIRRLSLDELLERAEAFWPESAHGADKTRKKQLLTIIQERLKTLADIPAMTEYFFNDPTINLSLLDDNKQLKKLDRAEQKALLQTALTTLEQQTNFSPDAIQATLNQLLETTNQKPGTLFSLIRLALTWAPFSPALDDTIALLGLETTKRRLRTAIDAL